MSTFSISQLGVCACVCVSVFFFKFIYYIPGTQIHTHGKHVYLHILIPGTWYVVSSISFIAHSASGHEHSTRHATHKQHEHINSCNGVSRSRTACCSADTAVYMSRNVETQCVAAAKSRAQFILKKNETHKTSIYEYSYLVHHVCVVYHGSVVVWWYDLNSTGCAVLCCVVLSPGLDYSTAVSV